MFVSKPSPSGIMTEVYSRLAKNEGLHIILEQEANKMQYGQVTVNVVLKNGKADMKTFNLVKQRRLKYEKGS